MHVPSACAGCVPQQRQLCMTTLQRKPSMQQAPVEPEATMGKEQNMVTCCQVHRKAYLHSAHVSLRHAAVSAQLSTQQRGAAHQLPGGGSWGSASDAEPFLALAGSTLLLVHGGTVARQAGGVVQRGSACPWEGAPRRSAASPTAAVLAVI